MKLPVLRRGSYANVTATLALVVALSGTSYAAGLITSKQIKDGTIKPADLHASAVTNPKIAPNAVTGAKIKDKSITKADLAPGTLPTVPAIPAPYAGVSGRVTQQDNPIPFDGSLDTIATINLPAPGKYLATATTTIANGGVTIADVTCYFLDNAGVPIDRRRIFVDTDAPREDLTLQMATTLSTAGTLTLGCLRDDGTNLTAAQTKISAITVDNLSVVG